MNGTLTLITFSVRLQTLTFRVNSDQEPFAILFHKVRSQRLKETMCDLETFLPLFSQHSTIPKARQEYLD